MTSGSPTYGVFLSLFEPFAPVHLSARGDVLAGEILRGVGLALRLQPKDAALLRLTARGGRSISERTCVEELAEGTFVELEVRLRQLGGKGGFGNQLRAAGARMANKNGNVDSCRDLNGRRLSTIKEAQRLAEYIEKEPERQKELDEAQARKYAKLEKMLGRKPKSTKDFEEAAQKLDDAGDQLEADAEAGPVAGPSRAPKRKERIEDHEYVEQSREIVDNVRNAVALAMKKKKKKAAGKAPAADTAASSAVETKSV
ncbi:hypothetical protein MOBT1_002702 [Malassezia obtusa]|uniref:SDE2-like domain-containing protein n=1 Tax=Malassezia obtusa TaxID=76774 RepID=A0AAF0E2F3_9BASI|nr:hypothetical protein MOBT1_002702 [Malassezia obtusa]